MGLAVSSVELPLATVAETELSLAVKVQADDTVTEAFLEIVLSAKVWFGAVIMIAIFIAIKATKNAVVAFDLVRLL